MINSQLTIHDTVSQWRLPLSGDADGTVTTAEQPGCWLERGGCRCCYAAAAQTTVDPSGGAAGRLILLRR